MRIGLDFDGCVCEGKYLVQPARAHETYLALKPYDKDTIEVLCGLTCAHEVYIITSRSYNGAHWTISEWLHQEGARGFEPVGIITKIEQIEKWHLAGMMKCDIVIDDSPRVWQDARTSQRLYIPELGIQPEFILMDNPAWPENQALEFDGTRCRSWKELGDRIDSIATRKLHTSTTAL